MRIGLDVSSVPGQRAGGGQYAYQLARGLAAVDRKNTYLLYPTFYYLVHPEHRLAQLPEARNMRTALRWLPPALASYLWRVDRPEAFKERLLATSISCPARPTALRCSVRGVRGSSSRSTI